MSRRDAERGIALVVVLWALALFAAVLTGFAETSRTEVVLTRNLLERARAASLADGAVALAGQALLDPEARRTLRIDGAPQVRRIDGVPVTLRIQDEAGKIDLNLAPPDLLAGLFLSLGAPREQAEALAAAVVDYRDDDDARSLGGAEAADYADAGRFDRPRNGALDSILELQQVLGMTATLWQRAAPLVTVHGLQPGVDTSVAPPGVLAALPGVASAAAPSRPPAFAAGTVQPPADPALQRWFNASPGIAYGVVAEVPMVGGAPFRREAVLWLLQRPDQPFVVVAWR